jgi:hypothetical protein
MKKKIYFTLAFSFMLVYSSHSYNPKIIDTLKIYQQIKKFGLNEEILNFKVNFFESIVFKNDSTIYYNPDGTLHLFEIHLGVSPVVHKISKSIHSGHNFNRNLFLYKETLYSFGGNGLFNSFPGIIHFDPSLGGWLENKIKNYPFDINRVVNSWVNGDSLIVLLSHTNDWGSTSKVKYSFGEINLKTFEYLEHFNFKDSSPEFIYGDGIDKFRGNYNYDSELYSLHGYFKEDGGCDYRIFDKTAGVLKRTSKLDALKRVDGFSYLYIEGSKIYYRDTLGAIESFDVNSGTVIDSINYPKKYKSKVDNNQQYIGVSFSVLAIIFLVFIKTRKKKTKTIQTTQELANIENNFINIKHTIITKEKIDDLLGISHYSYETIKTKRSSMINKLNQNGKIKIERIRKQSDKRFYDYKIS